MALGLERSVRIIWSGVLESVIVNLVLMDQTVIGAHQDIGAYTLEAVGHVSAALMAQ